METRRTRSRGRGNKSAATVADADSVACTTLRPLSANDCVRASCCTQAGKRSPSATGCGPCRWKRCGPKTGECQSPPSVDAFAGAAETGQGRPEIAMMQVL